VFEAANTLEADATGANGTLTACLTTAAALADAPVARSIDDGPYYKNTVLPLQNWYLNLYFEAFTVITEAWHILALESCINANGGDTSTGTNLTVCNTTGTIADVIDTICPSSNAPSACGTPQSWYATDSGGNITSYLKSIFQWGCAPYSNDDYLMVNGYDYLIARSIEQYNVAADPGNTAGLQHDDPRRTDVGPR
jgi:hypothetical protein